MNIELREVMDSDLDLFFMHQQNKEAQYMAAFVHKDPSDRAAFDAHWKKILSKDEIIIRTILYGGTVVGHIAKFVMFEEPELTYWIDHNYWGKGIATKALGKFIHEVSIRPIYARVAKDNTGSIKVLEKCGFGITGEDRGFANARNEEIEEWILSLEK